MEAVDVCQGKAWRVRIRAHDAASRNWLSTVLASWASDGQSIQPVLPNWTDGAWEFQAPREFASEEDPLIELEFASDATRAEVRASLRGSVSVLTNHARDSDVFSHEGTSEGARLATVEETFELAMCWVLAFHHPGCRDLDINAFWGTRTHAIAFTVIDVAFWMACGSPIPQWEGASDVYVVYVGQGVSFRKLDRMFEALATSSFNIGGSLHAGSSPGERVLLATACVDPGTGVV